MSKYSKEKKQEHLAIVRRIISTKRDASGVQVMEILKNSGLKFDEKYVYKLFNTIINERRVRYDRETKNEVVAKFEDFIKALEPKLQKLSETGFKDSDKINAIKLLAQNYKEIINLQMDLGVLERNLGTIKTEGYHFDIVKIAKMVEQVKKEKEENAKRITNSGSDGEQPEVHK